MTSSYLTVRSNMTGSPNNSFPNSRRKTRNWESAFTREISRCVDFLFREGVIWKLLGGFKVWCDMREINIVQVGVTVTENIVDCIYRSSKFLMVLSEGFIKSQWCQFESHVAQHKLNNGERWEQKWNFCPGWEIITSLFFRDAIILILKDKLEHRVSSHISFMLKTRTYLKWPDEDKKQQHFWLKLKQSIHVYRPFSELLHAKKRLRLNSL